MQYGKPVSVQGQLKPACLAAEATVIILSFRANGSGQTVQTQIRLLLEMQSDQDLHCLLFHLHILTKYAKVWPIWLNFR